MAGSLSSYVRSHPWSTLASIVSNYWSCCSEGRKALTWDVRFYPENIKELLVGQVTEVELWFNRTDLHDEAEGGMVLLEYLIEDKDIAESLPPTFSVNSTEFLNDSVPYPKFDVKGLFLGRTKLKVRRTDDGGTYETAKDLDVTVLRETGVLDLAFTYSVATLVGIIYINMGAAVDTRIITETLKKPIGPAIGFFSQFVIMPMLSYVIAKALIPMASLQLGLFITGCSPGGGASNIWTLTLGGNLDLSITMTTISTFSAFFMMPLWILTLGASIMREANLGIPYRNIATFAVALIVPLAIGIVIQRTLPRAAKFLVRILKPFALFLIIYIVVFAVYTNLFLFQLFSWQIVVSGLLLPWLGYLLGGGLAWVCRQDPRDILAIAIETGVQNTGLAILALRLSLPAPESDLTTVLPVAVAIMTPVIPLLILIFQKVTGRGGQKSKDSLIYSAPASTELSISSTGSGI